MPPFPNEEIEVKINYLILGYETKKKKSEWHILPVTWR